VRWEEEKKSNRKRGRIKDIDERAKGNKETYRV